MYNMVNEIIMTLIPLCTLPYLSRVLGVNGMGTYTYTLALAGMFILFERLGVQMYGNRSIAIVRDNKEERNTVFSGIYMQQMFCTIIVSIAYVLYILMFARQYEMLLWILLLYVMGPIFDISWLFYGVEDFKSVSIYTIIIKLCSMVLTFSFVRQGEDIWKYTFITALDQLCVNLILWIKSRKYVRLQRVDYHEVLRHLKPCCVLFIPIIAVNVYRTMDKIMLKTMSSNIEVGLYQSASQLQTCLLGAITALGTVSLPHISHLVSHKRRTKIKQIMEESMIFSMFCACGVAFGIAAVGERFIPLFYGDDFIDAIPILWVLVPSIIVIAWANVIRVQYLIPEKKDYVVVLCVCSGAIINVIINLLLIPHLYGVGAAIGTVCAEVSVVCLQWIFVRGEVDVMSYLKKTIYFMIIGAVMMMITIWIGNTLATSFKEWLYKDYIIILIQIASGIVLYLSLSALYFYRYKHHVRKEGNAE